MKNKKPLSLFLSFLGILLLSSCEEDSYDTEIKYLGTNSPIRVFYDGQTIRPEPISATFSLGQYAVGATVSGVSLDFISVNNQASPPPETAYLDLRITAGTKRIRADVLKNFPSYWLNSSNKETDYSAEISWEVIPDLGEPMTFTDTVDIKVIGVDSQEPEPEPEPILGELVFVSPTPVQSSKVHGIFTVATSVLDSEFNVKSVNYYIAASGSSRYLIAEGKKDGDKWIAKIDTTLFPDAQFEILAEATLDNSLKLRAVNSYSFANVPSLYLKSPLPTSQICKTTEIKLEAISDRGPGRPARFFLAYPGWQPADSEGSAGGVNGVYLGQSQPVKTGDDTYSISYDFPASALPPSLASYILVGNFTDSQGAVATIGFPLEVASSAFGFCYQFQPEEVIQGTIDFLGQTGQSIADFLTNLFGG